MRTSVYSEVAKVEYGFTFAHSWSIIIVACDYDYHVKQQVYLPC